MRKKGCIRVITGCLALLLGLQAGITAYAAETEKQGGTDKMTPYSEAVSTDEFYNGAMFVLEKTADTKSWTTKELERMKYDYNINTINVYGLENYDDPGKTELKDHLFAELKRLDMKIVVRIESYDGSTYAFREEDADFVISVHDSLIQYVSQEGKREQVAYFALNMPVDDPAVQKNCGGLNSKTFHDNQVTYSEYFVKAMREKTAEYGFTDAKMYLSIFYGWDNSFRIPSYASAGADGYFVNNYSYPAAQVPKADAEPEQLINAPRLSVSMETFLKQYGAAPLVVEFGFHTVEYNNGVVPNQTAGVVWDREAKKKAIRATLDFYQTKYPNVCGTLYFGYNLYKEEGNPPAVMDWTLCYPPVGMTEAEDGSVSGGAKTVSDESMSNGQAVLLENTGDGIQFLQCPTMQQLVLGYKADKDTKVLIYSNGRLKKELMLPAAEEVTVLGIPLVVVEGYDLEIKTEEAGAVTLDYVMLNPRMECEYVERDGNILKFEETRGGSKMELSYTSPEDTVLVLGIGGKNFSLKLPAAENKTLEVEINIPMQGSFTLAEKEENGLELDWIQLSGTPESVPDENTDYSNTGEDNEKQDEEQPAEVPKKFSGIVKYLPAIGCIVVALGAVASILFKNKKRK